MANPDLRFGVDAGFFELFRGIIGVQSVLELGARLGEFSARVIKYPHHVHVQQLRPRVEVGAASFVVVRDLLPLCFQFIEATLARGLEVFPEALRRHVRTVSLSFALP